MTRFSLLISIGYGVSALPTYVDLIPNAALFDEGGMAVGHFNFDSQNRTLFAKDFAEHNYSWTAICGLDSDKDGVLNKDELGDPDCTGTATITDITLLSNPGDGKDFIAPAQAPMPTPAPTSIPAPAPTSINETEDGALPAPAPAKNSTLAPTPASTPATIQRCGTVY